MKDEYSEEEYLHDQREEAKREEKIETAKAMLKEGMDFTLISKITGFSEQALQKF
jgi:predicted transposase/invertase (TIGR01784 family)